MNHLVRRPRKTRSQWQAIITEFNQSHLPARIFCGWLWLGLTCENK